MLIAGFAKAVELCENNLQSSIDGCIRIKNNFYKALDGLTYTINGDPQYCIPSTINISIDGLDAEAAFLCLGDDYAFSNGSACNSSTHELSYVLDAMGLSEKRKAEAIRLSWNVKEDIDFTPFVNIVRSII